MPRVKPLALRSSTLPSVSEVFLTEVRLDDPVVHGLLADRDDDNGNPYARHWFEKRLVAGERLESQGPSGG